MLLMTRPTNYRRVCQMTDIQLTDDEQQRWRRRRRHHQQQQQQQRENVTFLVYIARSTKQSVCSLVVSVFFSVSFFLLLCSFLVHFDSLLIFFVVRSLYLIFYAFYKWIRMLSACTLILSDWSRVWSQRVLVDGTERETTYRRHRVAGNRANERAHTYTQHQHKHTHANETKLSFSIFRSGRWRAREM